GLRSLAAADEPCRKLANRQITTRSGRAPLAARKTLRCRTDRSFRRALCADRSSHIDIGCSSASREESVRRRWKLGTWRFRWPRRRPSCENKPFLEFVGQVPARSKTNV